MGTGRMRVRGEGGYREKEGMGRGWAQGEGGNGEKRIWGEGGRRGKVGTGGRWVQGEGREVQTH